MHILERLVSISGSSDATVPFSKTQLSTIANQLADPAILTELPFPSVWNNLPERFKCTGDDKKWNYMGREKFPMLLEAVQTLELTEWHGYWLYGTIGYGKSHLIAALVCYLIATGKRVVYLPDTWDACDYVQAAMLFAWGAPEDSDMRKRIMALKTMEDIREFFKGQKKILFVFDQMNALEPDHNENDPASNGEKKEISQWLRKYAAGHKCIFSASANNQSKGWMQHKQTGFQQLHVYRGFSEVCTHNTLNAGPAKQLFRQK